MINFIKVKMQTGKQKNQIKKIQSQVEELTKNNKYLLDENNMLKTKLRCLNKENKFLIARENKLQTLETMIKNKAKISEIRKYVEEMK